jgi:NADP-dependent aldehyde dehydrogenase
MEELGKLAAVNEIVEAAAAGCSALVDTAQRARLLEAIAAEIEAEREAILRVCEEETGLWKAELEPEFARMAGTLRLFAERVREGSWVRAAIDRRAGTPGGPTSTIGPNHDVRSILVPLEGVVAVFGASNFPLAYGVCGGDTASALAAGCAVVVKEHPGHPRTGRLIASIASGAADRVQSGLIGYVRNEDPKDFSIATALVTHPSVIAVGFTGSLGGGRALEKLAGGREVPIPVFAEMGSVNAVFVAPGAAGNRGEVIADEIADSIFARVGQQCTKAGVIFIVQSEASERLERRLAERFARAPYRQMLSKDIRARFGALTKEIEDSEAATLVFSTAVSEDLDERFRGTQSHQWRTDVEGWLSTEALRQEVFGPSCVSVMLLNWSEIETLPREGRLVISVYADPDDPQDVDCAKQVLTWHGQGAGRITFNSVSTGVRVCDAMVHGGPHPATNVAHTTAVGARAIERWCRPVCFQNFPDALLPKELRDANPRGILRQVDGVFTREPIVRT